jgi:hypothetical protein
MISKHEIEERRNAQNKGTGSQARPGREGGKEKAEARMSKAQYLSVSNTSHTTETGMSISLQPWYTGVN